MVEHERQPPGPLIDAWSLAVGHADPLIALAATRALRAHLSEWETRLVREALDSGHTWEAIGQALGVSRQAAWDRFRLDASESRRSYDRKVGALRAEVERLRRRAREG